MSLSYCHTIMLFFLFNTNLLIEKLMSLLLCYTIHITSHHITSHHSTAQHTQHSTAQHSTAQHSTVQYSTAIKEWDTVPN